MLICCQQARSPLPITIYITTKSYFTLLSFKAREHFAITNVSFSHDAALLLTIIPPAFQHYLELAAEYPNEEDSNYEIIEGRCSPSNPASC